MNESLPFEENWVSQNVSIRKFKTTSKSDELKWHFDQEDRIIEAIGETDWMFQYDNKLPQEIRTALFIKKGEWHRLIKGNGDLEIKITRV